MSDHYYSKNPRSELVTKNWDYTLRGHLFTFKSGQGVFSKNSIDFGTRLLIETFEEPHVAGDILDLGCGYGPIGISLAYHFPHRNVTLLDVNERAVMLAKENAMQNKVNNVTVIQSDQLSSVRQAEFAAIVTNPPIRAGKKIIQSFYEQSKKHLVEKGELWVVIQKKQGAPSTIDYLSTLFATVNVLERKKGYFIIRAIKN